MAVVAQPRVLEEHSVEYEYSGELEHPRAEIVVRFASMPVFFVGSLAIGCHGSQPRALESTPRNGERSVFTDSALHVEKCAPLQRGEDWRKVCVPKDQSVQVRPKP